MDYASIYGMLFKNIHEIAKKISIANKYLIKKINNLKNSMCLIHNVDCIILFFSKKCLLFDELDMISCD